MKQKQQLRIYEDAAGATVVFLHGFVSTHRYWNGVVNILKNKKLHLVRPDLLGFGKSPKPRQAVYNINDHIKWLDQSLKSIDIDGPFYLVGHSMGASIALEWALREPKKIKSLVLTSIPTIKQGKIRHQVVGLTNKQYLLKDRIVGIAFRTGHMVVSYMPRSVTKFIIKGVPKHVASDTAKNKPRVLRRVVKHSFFSEEEQTLSRLRSVKIKTKLIMADNDSLVYDLSRVKETVNNNESIELKVVNGSHQIPLEHPELVASEIIGIIEPNERVKNR